MPGRNVIGTVLVAIMLVLAGCSSGVTSPTPSGNEDVTAETGEATGTVNFYLSDQPTAIGDFEHLNVTVTKIVLVKTEQEDEESASEGGTDSPETGTAIDTDEEAEDDGERIVREVDVTLDLTELQGANASLVDSFEVPNGTYGKVFLEVSRVNATLKNGESAEVKLPSERLQLNERFTVGNNQSIDFVFDVSVVQRGNGEGYILKPVVSESGTGDEVEINRVDEDEQARSDEDEESPTSDDSANLGFYVSDERNAIEDFEHLNVTIMRIGVHRTGEGGGEWFERSVDNETVDLTKLQGANATLLNRFQIPNGTYDKAFVYVDEVNGTLDDGTNVRVKLPSERLHVTKAFTVEDGEELEFVFDITVFRAGDTGKYILKPVVNESGTDVDIDPTEEDGSEAGEESNLNASFVGEASPGTNVTVAVSRNRTNVQGATVAVEQDGSAGTYVTGENGTVTFRVDANTTELEVTVTEGDDKTKLEREFEEDNADLEATFRGDVTPGSNATVLVTVGEEPTENVTVVVTQNESSVRYRTGPDGTVTFAVDENATVLVAVIEYENESVELTEAFAEEDEEESTEDENAVIVPPRI